MQAGPHLVAHKVPAHGQFIHTWNSDPSEQATRGEGQTLPSAQQPGHTAFAHGV